MENKYQIDVKLCDGEKCIHRYRCYRHSLFNDALFKGNSFDKINAKECISPEDEDVIGYSHMWLPDNIPSH